MPEKIEFLFDQETVSKLDALASMLKMSTSTVLRNCIWNEFDLRFLSSPTTKYSPVSAEELVVFE